MPTGPGPSIVAEGGKITGMVGLCCSQPRTGQTSQKPGLPALLSGKRVLDGDRFRGCLFIPFYYYFH
jgi:hypothetical protein